MRATRAGFTLWEVIVALAVMGVAVSVFVSLFNASTDLGQTATNRSEAARIAGARLEDIARRPSGYVWGVQSAPAGQAFPIALGAGDPPAGNPCEPPALMPDRPDAARRAADLAARFRWKAFGRLPAADAAHAEVTVQVLWQEEGRPQSLALTTAAALPAGGRP